jgi:archaetidylinositol phosphate synthase
MRKRKTKEPRTKHERVIDTFTGKLERKILHKLAGGLPAWVTPDMLTGVSLVSALAIAASYAFSGQTPWLLWAACAGFVINWYGDSLDGTLARYRHIERPRYGYFLDHSIDAINETAIFIGIGLSGYVRMEIALVALAGYLLVSLYTALAIYVTGQFKISYAYLGPTEIRLIAMIASIWVYFDSSRFVALPFGNFTFFELITMGLIVLFYSAFLFSTIGQIVRLSRVDVPH